jgi:hypothetical protein
MAEQVEMVCEDQVMKVVMKVGKVVHCLCLFYRAHGPGAAASRVCTFHHDAMNMNHQSFTTYHHTNAPPTNIASPPSTIPRITPRTTVPTLGQYSTP